MKKSLSIEDRIPIRVFTKESKKEFIEFSFGKDTSFLFRSYPLMTPLEEVYRRLHEETQRINKDCDYYRFWKRNVKLEELTTIDDIFLNSRLFCASVQHDWTACMFTKKDFDIPAFDKLYEWYKEDQAEEKGWTLQDYVYYLENEKHRFL